MCDSWDSWISLWGTNEAPGRYSRMCRLELRLQNRIRRGTFCTHVKWQDDKSKDSCEKSTHNFNDFSNFPDFTPQDFVSLNVLDVNSFIRQSNIIATISVHYLIQNLIKTSSSGPALLIHQLLLRLWVLWFSHMVQNKYEVSRVSQTWEMTQIFHRIPILWIQGRGAVFINPTNNDSSTLPLFKIF